MLIFVCTGCLPKQLNFLYFWHKNKPNDTLQCAPLQPKEHLNYWAQLEKFQQKSNSLWTFRVQLQSHSHAGNPLARGSHRKHLAVLQSEQFRKDAPFCTPSPKEAIVPALQVGIAGSCACCWVIYREFRAGFKTMWPPAPVQTLTEKAGRLENQKWWAFPCSALHWGLL